ncbi:MAG: glycosyltransferase [Chloroflexi bacterium]|nr:glycosyltransferase [Chloroflexota bacterium]
MMPAVALAAQAALAIVAIALALLTTYLVVLTVAAAFASKHGPPAAGGSRRFAVLVPAHNEEALIGRLLESLAQMQYPREQYDVCVVADNCTDATASIARAAGARVYERVDDRERAKGFALRWLLQRLRDEAQAYDAYLVLDADTVVAPNFLRAMDARLEAGSKVIQAYYSVQNAHQSRVAGLRYAALAAVHYVRPLGRSLFGFSCGLKGNGMCFAAPVLERFSWNWFTLAEDVEFHLALVGAGIRVDFAPETAVYADMPVSLAQAASQNARWERGRLQLVRQHVPRLVLDGLRHASLLRLDAAAEQLIPPLSVPFALGGLCMVLAAVVGSPEIALLAAASLVGQVAYLMAGLLMVRAPLSMYLALSAAPVYIAWKVGLYGRALVTGSAASWVRTAR